MARISARDNMLRAIFFQNPEYIPVSYVINPSYYFTNDPEDVLDGTENTGRRASSG